MNGTRRAFLSAAGIAALSGCLGDDRSTPSVRTESSGPRSGPDASETAASDPGERRSATADRERSKTTIGFGGDTMLGRHLNDVYGREDVDPASIWGDFQPRLTALDGVCCNLECCLSTRGERYPDRAYYFRGDPAWAVPALEAGNVRFAGLANNHAMDFGAVALRDTIDVLTAEEVHVAGTGETPAAARAPTTFTIGGLDVAAISFSEEGGTYAVTDGRPGIAWADCDRANRRTRRVVGNSIERARASDPDLVVASVHWGENWVERPGDRLIEFGHWLVDRGVDLVHGHSAHVVQAVEQYGDGLILHDTGNLVDDFRVKDDLGNDKSFLFEVTLAGGEFEAVRLRPFHIDDGVSRASEDEAAWLRETMRDRSTPFETTYEREGEGLVVQL